MIKAILETALLFLILGICAFGAAGQLAWPGAWTVLGVELAFKVAAFIFVDPELLSERAAPGPGVYRGDAVLSSLGYLLIYPLTLVVAGLDVVRFGPAIPMPLFIQVTALLLFTAGKGFAFWAVLCNPFFSTFVRIQDDHEQFVVSSGAYAVVRHPGYAGFLLAHLALPFALGSIWALLPAFAGAILFVVRTSREDSILHDHLAGYDTYQSQVRWRLIPGIW